MVIENQYFHNVVKYATQIRGAITGIIFDKSLRLASTENSGALTQSDGKSSSSAKERRKKGLNEREDMDEKQRESRSLGVGGVLNLMQTDASVLESAALQLHTLWDGPLQVCNFLCFLFFDCFYPTIYLMHPIALFTAHFADNHVHLPSLSIPGPLSALWHIRFAAYDTC